MYMISGVDRVAMKGMGGSKLSTPVLDHSRGKHKSVKKFFLYEECTVSGYVCAWLLFAGIY